MITPQLRKWVMETDAKTAIARLRGVEELVGKTILRTPTGEVRNALTEANIHVMAAIDKLSEVVGL